MALCFMPRRYIYHERARYFDAVILQALYIRYCLSQRSTIRAMLSAIAAVEAQIHTLTSLRHCYATAADCLARVRYGAL